MREGEVCGRAASQTMIIMCLSISYAIRCHHTPPYSLFKIKLVNIIEDLDGLVPSFRNCRVRAVWKKIDLGRSLVEEN